MSKPLLSFLVIALTFATAVLDAWANADGLRRQGRRATLRFETRSTASMLFRHVDLDLADYQFLIWRWYIEEPIESPLDERTREGDDHPAQLFLVFRTATGRTAGWRSSGAISSKLATTNISEGFPIMWLTAATRTLGNGEARRSTYGRSIATFGQMGRPPISSTLRFSAIPTRPTATLSAILPM